MNVNIKPGLQVHDIFNRRWLTVTKVNKDNTIKLKGYYCWITLQEKDFINMVKSSPLNKEILSKEECE